TVELSGPSTLSNYSYGTWCVNIQNCSSVQSINWAYSTDGWSYTSDGTGTCYMQNMFLGGNFPVGYFILRVTVVCSDGQTITKFLTVNNSTGLISSNQDSKSAAKTKENKFNPEIDFVDDFKLFPNPATNDFNVWYKFKANTTTIISLTSMDGKSSVLLNRANEIDGDEIYNVNVKNMTPGIYLITVRNGEDYSTKRIVIHE
ncbi:MAG: T9SS type A sorting domain-containing protein, partial [Bacteroidia bacterium]|nr:T9SS type A sorting domain-containing protein [Bacteroidia bacterium]